MLSRARALKGYKIHARDGEIGKVDEFYFDDHFWTIRYLIVDTGNWLTGRQVLLTPYSVLSIDGAEKFITTNLTKQQIENSPALESDKPVSRQFEESYYGYYDLPQYWGGPYGWGMYSYLQRDQDEWKRQPPFSSESNWDPNLRSTRDVGGHHVQGSDGAIGHVADFLIDSETWAIRYLIVSTGNWWSGKKVLISPQWVERVSWVEAKVFVSLSRDAIRNAPEYSENSLPTRDYEAELFRHYKRSGYWVDEPAA